MKNYLSSWLYVPAPEQHIIIAQYIKAIKFLHKVIGDVWHNGEGSTVHKSRRIGLISVDTLWSISLDAAKIEIL